MKTKNLYKKILIFACAFLLMFLAVFESVFLKTPIAFADEQKYSNVLDDLQSGGEFDSSLYPSIANDYSLKVIQVAESSDRELFVYVYQPSNDTKDLKATRINMAAFTGSSLTSHLYSLSLVSSNGVFDKYVVNDFTVSESNVRIYSITSIYRLWEESVDKATGNDNTISEIAYPVGKKWTALTSGNDVLYSAEDVEIVNVTGMYTGFIRYYGNSLFGGEHYDSFYVGFKTEKKIENLISAKVYANVSKRTVVQKVNIGIVSPKSDTESTPEEKEFIVNRGVKSEFKTTGILSKKHYTWDEIQTVDEFFARENMTPSQVLKDNRDNIDWVLRFFNAPVTVNDSSSILGFGGRRTTTSYLCKDVGIIELTFESDGVTYVQGVVSNLQTGSKNPTGTNPDSDKDKNWLAWLIAIALIVALIVAFPSLLGLLILAVQLVVKFVVFLFKLIYKGLKRIVVGIKNFFVKRKERKQSKLKKKADKQKQKKSNKKKNKSSKAKK